MEKEKFYIAVIKTEQGKIIYKKINVDRALVFFNKYIGHIGQNGKCKIYDRNIFNIILLKFNLL